MLEHSSQTIILDFQNCRSDALTMPGILGLHKKLCDRLAQDNQGQFVRMGEGGTGIVCRLFLREGTVCLRSYPSTGYVSAVVDWHTESPPEALALALKTVLGAQTVKTASVHHGAGHSRENH